MGSAWPAFLLAGILALLGVAHGSRVASADDEEIPTRLEYRAGPQCPSEEAFAALVRARLPRVRFVSEGSPGRAFAVELRADGEHAAGTLTATSGNPAAGARRIDAPTCSELADALALMLVLAIDPSSLSAAAPVRPLDAGLVSADAAASPLVEDASSATPRDAAREDDAGLPPPQLPLAVPASADSPVSNEGPSSTPRLRHFSLGADFVVVPLVAPVVLYTGAPVLGYRTTTPALFGLFGANLRASFLRVGAADVATGTGSADYTWTVGRIDGCAMRWPDRALRLGVCARVEAGVIEGFGHGITTPIQAAGLWFAAGPLARVEWSVWGPFFIGADLGPSVQVTNYQFEFRPNPVVYRVPLFGIWTEAGIGAHFL